MNLQKSKYISLIRPTLFAVAIASMPASGCSSSAATPVFTAAMGYATSAAADPNTPLGMLVAKPLSYLRGSDTTQVRDTHSESDSLAKQAEELCRRNLVNIVDQTNAVEKVYIRSLSISPPETPVKMAARKTKIDGQKADGNSERLGAGYDGLKDREKTWINFCSGVMAKDTSSSQSNDIKNAIDGQTPNAMRKLGMRLSDF